MMRKYHAVHIRFEPALQILAISKGESLGPCQHTDFYMDLIEFIRGQRGKPRVPECRV